MMFLIRKYHLKGDRNNVRAEVEKEREKNYVKTDFWI